MPLKTWNTRADFDATYRVGAEPDGRPNTRPEVKLHYHRSVMLPIAQKRATELIRLLTIVAGNRLAMLGAGFGWTAERIAAEAGAVIVAIDTSTYIRDAATTTEESEIREAISAVGLDPDTGRGAELLARHSDGQPRARVTIFNEDLANNQSRNRVRNALGGNPTWVITEHLLESFTDAECITIDTRCRALGPTAHLIEPTQVGNLPGYNRKTPAEWKTLLPNSQILSSQDWTRI